MKTVEIIIQSHTYTHHLSSAAISLLRLAKTAFTFSLYLIFGPTQDEAPELFRILHNEGHFDLYRARGTVTTGKSMRLYLTGHEASIRETRNAYTILMGNFLENIHMED
jgi:hypothetical protein